MKPISSSVTKTLIKDVEDSLNIGGPTAGSQGLLQELLEAVKAASKQEDVINSESMADFRWQGFVVPEERTKKEKVRVDPYLTDYYYRVTYSCFASFLYFIYMQLHL